MSVVTNNSETIKEKKTPWILDLKSKHVLLLQVRREQTKASSENNPIKTKT